MATEKQIVANRRNAKKSTGPRTPDGKLRSRQNAFRHGLTAKTVITELENAHEYKKLADAILADYQPASAIEYELVTRLTSLLWRLRRAVAIESGLFEIQGQIICERRQRNAGANQGERLKIFHDLLKEYDPEQATDNHVHDDSRFSKQSLSSTCSLDLALCFLRIGNFNNGFLETIGCYETRLWRQVAQIVLMLDSVGKAPLCPTGNSRYLARISTDANTG